MSTPRWGDADDSDDEEERRSFSKGGGFGKKLVIPPTHRSRVNAQGIQIITSYRLNPSNNSQLLKTVTRVKVSVEKVREPIAVGVRRKWKKFGQALKDEADGTHTTVHSKEEVLIEDPNADNDLQDEDPAAAISSNINEFWKKQKLRQLNRQYDLGDDTQGAERGDWTQVGHEGSGSDAVGAGASSSTGKYVPPSARNGGAAAYKPPERRDDFNTIRVTNLSENTTEADLQELFERYGRISRVYLAKDKETMQSRGFAFVSFVDKSDAARAMEELQGFGYDHLILKLEWARPNTPKDPATSGNEYRSGYGKALAQDTKEKVSFASNLTK